MKKRIFKQLATVAVASLMLLTGCTANGVGFADEETSSQEQNTSNNEIVQEYEQENAPIATIEIEDFGTIKAELYPDLAPNTVNNFIYLANTGYYDGLIFHRIIEDFMIQGGCPEGTGAGNPGYSIAGEFENNGFSQNILTHTPGVLSMARAMDNNSAGSQFFIMTSTSPHLDGNYAGFGKVTEGMDIVMEIAAVDTSAGDRPDEDVVIKSITVDTMGETYDEPTPYGVATFIDEYEQEDAPIATIEIEGFGVITAELYPDLAPNTVNNFIYLANTGYYDGLTFHRIIENFMIQGGCPEGTGTGNPGYSIEGEFASNGFSQNNLSHTTGVLSMARSMNNNSAGSQFFIMNAASPHLDGEYAAFGKVIDGIDVVMEISAVSTNGSDKPDEDVVIKSITVDTVGKEYSEPIHY